jgi:hypothetical protein
MTGGDTPAGSHHAQHPASEWRARCLRREDVSLQASPESVDQHAGRPQTG